MNYRRNKTTISWKNCIAIVFVLFVTVSFFSDSFRASISNFSRTILAFVVQEKNEDFFTSRSKLISERDMYRENATKNEIYNAQNQILIQENTALMRTIGRMQENNIQEEFFSAHIISTPPYSPYDVLVVEGSYEVGSRVYALGTVFIGYVSAASDNTSQIRLSTSSNVSSTAVIEVQKENNEDMATGADTESEAEYMFLAEDVLHIEMIGRGNGEFVAKIPHSISVSENAVVSYPLHNTPIGKVKRIVSDEREPFQNIFIESLINPKHLRFVQIGDVDVDYISSTE